MELVPNSESEEPSSSTTFLFTDIEGSTGLWESHTEAMKRALARHDQLVRRAIQAHGGEVFKTVGDAFCTVFESPRSAIDAAIGAQLELGAENWPDGLQIKVRMAIHTGEAEERDGDYFGPSLNRVARLLSACHGGQILASETSAERVDPHILRSLGEHHLKDLARPERVFQAVGAGLPQEFPALRTLDHLADKHNLPHHLTSFVGRDQELNAVRGLLSQSRLLTLTGSGGVGKTRLASQLLSDVLPTTEEGTWIIDLAPLTDPGTLVSAVATAIAAGSPNLEGVVQRIGKSSMVLLFDNCEHVLGESARVIEHVLRHCPRLKVVATSREPLSLPGEYSYRVPSLSLPGAFTHTVEEAAQSESVRLFCERVRLSASHFELQNEDVPAIVSICRRLDGIPFAIELAAARAQWFSVQEINDRLNNRFRLLTGGSRTALPRQQTLRSLIDWSYDLLDPVEQTVLARLSVFAGGWNMAHAELVVAGAEIDEADVLPTVMSLASKSLVVVDQTLEPTRFRFLETVRQYARDRLTDSPDSILVRDRHMGCFLDVARKADDGQNAGEQQFWFTTLDTEIDNLRAALEWACTPLVAGIEGLSFVKALWRYWYVRGMLAEGSEWGARALSVGSQVPSQELAGALTGAGVLASEQGALTEAKECIERSREIYEALGDRASVGSALNNLANILHIEGDYARVRAIQEEVLILFRAIGDERRIARTVNNLALVMQTQGEFSGAKELYEEALAINRGLEDDSGVALALHNLGWLCDETGDLDSALIHYSECLEIRTRLNHRAGLAETYANLGDLYFSKGDFGKAEECFVAGRRISMEAGNPRFAAGCSHGMALIALDQGDIPGAIDKFRECAETRGGTADPRGDALFLVGLAELFLHAGMAPEAVMALAKATEIAGTLSLEWPREVKVRGQKCEAGLRLAIVDELEFQALSESGANMSVEEFVQIVSSLAAAASART